MYQNSNYIISFQDQVLKCNFINVFAAKPFLKQSRLTQLSLLIMFLSGMVFQSCSSNWETKNVEFQVDACKKKARKGFDITNRPKLRGALLASRYESLEDLKSEVEITYFVSGSDGDTSSPTRVSLSVDMDGKKTFSELGSGITQGDIYSASKGTILEQLELLINCPYAISRRNELEKIYHLARRRRYIYGVNDVAFFDLAAAAVEKITTPELAYLVEQDSSEKGYVNTFNHITAQALISTCFSKEIADFMGDVHERHYMPELTTGLFSNEHCTNPDNNPVDNYVDMMNNEWGQQLGVILKKKLKITPATYWSAGLLANYLNELQRYYSWSLQIGMKPFSCKEELVIKYAKKLNRILNDGLPKNQSNWAIWQ